MAHEIRPLAVADIPELSRFLTEGFGTAPDAPFAAPDVLRWKYFDPRADRDEPRSWVAYEEGRLIGHLGLCPGAFLGANLPAGQVPTLHMIDWLSGRPGSGVGARLMLRAHQGVPTAYGFGGSTAGRAVIGGGGYKLIGTVPVYQRVLQLDAALRAGRIGRAAKDFWQTVRNPARMPRATVELRPVVEFGPEIGPVLNAYQRVTVFSDRRAAMLNHLLRYPRGGISGWLVTQSERVRGFGLLSVVEQGGVRTGKLVDCVLDDLNPALWHAATAALTSELKRQGAISVVACANTEWSAAALCACGFAARHSLDFRLRDKGGQIPADVLFHLTLLEADYAYT